MGLRLPYLVAPTRQGTSVHSFFTYPRGEGAALIDERAFPTGIDVITAMEGEPVARPTDIQRVMERVIKATWAP